MHNHIDMRKAAHVNGPVLWNEPDIADLQIPCRLDDQFEVPLNVAIGDHGFFCRYIYGHPITPHIKGSAFVHYGEFHIRSSLKSGARP